MALSPQLRNFCDSWRRKAAAYALADAFDRFFTSYVVDAQRHCRMKSKHKKQPKSVERALQGVPCLMGRRRCLYRD
jgi:hypothetical protein